MAAYQAGDFRAACNLIGQASPALYRFLAARTTRKSETDDLLQETWLRVHASRRTYRPGEPVMPWLFAIARRARVDHYRRSRRRILHEEPMHDDLEDTAAGALDVEQPEELEALLALLTPPERELIELLKLAGLTLDEVARATGTTIGAVKQKVHRAYKKLRGKSVRTYSQNSRGGVIL